MPHIVLATGDLAMDRDEYDESFIATRDVLREADLTFGQLETSFAEAGIRLPQARHAVIARPDGAGALARAGFDVISMAGAGRGAGAIRCEQTGRRQARFDPAALSLPAICAL